MRCLLESLSDLLELDAEECGVGNHDGAIPLEYEVSNLDSCN